MCHDVFTPPKKNGQYPLVNVARFQNDFMVREMSLTMHVTWLFFWVYVFVK